MTKLSSIISELSTLGTAMEKNASKSSSRLASFLDKIAEEAEKDENEEKCPECGKSKDECTCDSTKEGSVNKTAAQKIARAYKKAVLDNENTQGSTVQVGAKSHDGAATNAARDTDQIIPADRVESEAESNPEKHNSSTSSDLIEGLTPNSEDMADPLQKVSEAKLAEYLANGDIQLVSAKEKDLLTKFAGVGYNYLVEAYSDQLVQEKIASEIMAQKAAQAPRQIANAVLNQQQANSVKTAAANDQYRQALQNAYAQGYQQAAAQMSKQASAPAQLSQQDAATVQKLASIKKNDPQLFSALNVLAQRNLL